MESRQRLDQVLLSQGLVSEEQIREALCDQSVLGGRLGEHLVRRGVLEEQDLVDALSRQFGLPGIALGRMEYDPALFAVLPIPIAERYHCVPVTYDAEANALSVAFSSPDNTTALQAVEAAVAPAKLIPHVGSDFQIRRLLSGRQQGYTSPNFPSDAVGSITDTEVEDPNLDGLIDFLELAVSALDRARGKKHESAWMARLATEIAERRLLSPGIDRIVRIAALCAESSFWRHHPPSSEPHEVLRDAIVLAERFNVSPDVTAVLKSLAGDRHTLPPALAPVPEILRLVRALAESRLEAAPSESIDAWEKRFCENQHAAFAPALIETAFSVLRIRTLREGLGQPPSEIIVMGNDPLVDRLVTRLRKDGCRPVRAEAWSDIMTLTERRAPDLICVHAPSTVAPDDDLSSQLVSGRALTLSRILFLVGADIPGSVSRLVRHGARVAPAEESGINAVLRAMDKLDSGATATTGKQRRALSPQPTRPEPSVTGRLSDLGIADLVQVLSTTGKTVHVTLTSRHRHAELWFEQGQIIHGQADGLTGDAVFFDVLGWNDGRFEVHQATNLPARNISGQTTALLLEGLRRLDESSHRKMTPAIS